MASYVVACSRNSLSASEGEGYGPRPWSYGSSDRWSWSIAPQRSTWLPSNGRCWPPSPRGPANEWGSTLLEEAVWPGQPPPTARKTLQGHIARLRRALGATAIVERSGGYLLESGGRSRSTLG